MQPRPPTRRKFMKMALAVPAIGAMASPVWAISPVFKTDGFAIQGYDPVAYFTALKPVLGSDRHMLKWRGAIWRFSSAGNMVAFEMSPHIFAPQYGGYCAFVMSQGMIADSIPEAWTIYQDKLYLNFSTQARGFWRRDIAGYIEAANSFWPEILQG